MRKQSYYSLHYLHLATHAQNIILTPEQEANWQIKVRDTAKFTKTSFR